jgi:hypothetical protein
MKVKTFTCPASSWVVGLFESTALDGELKNVYLLLVK